MTNRRWRCLIFCRTWSDESTLSRIECSVILFTTMPTRTSCWSNMQSRCDFSHCWNVLKCPRRDSTVVIGSVSYCDFISWLWLTLFSFIPFFSWQCLKRSGRRSRRWKRRDLSFKWTSWNAGSECSGVLDTPPPQTSLKSRCVRVSNSHEHELNLFKPSCHSCWVSRGP